MLIDSCKRLTLFVLLILITQGLITISSNAQILDDTTAMTIIRKGIDLTYNMQFRDAESTFSELSRLYPDHPVNLLIKGIIIYWENYPMMPSSPEAASFEQLLHRCMNKCEEDKKSEYKPEILLTNLSARGMLLLYYTDNGISRKVISLAPGTYHYLKRSFANTSISTDFYFFTGLYNYYREAYPEFHPIYRPIASLFPKGNKARGIEELEIAATKSTFLKADSYSFLTWIFTNFEKNFPRAVEYNQKVAELYPLNYSYTVTYLKNLIAAKRYDEADKILGSVTDKVRNPFIEAQINVLGGLIRERKYKDLSSARNNYELGIRKLSRFGYIGNEFSSLGYAGLSRICESEGDQQGMRKNRRKAEDLFSN